MRRPDDRAHPVRHHQPDEPGEPGDARRRRGEERREARRDETRARDAEPDAVGAVVVEQEEVERAAAEQRRRDADGDRPQRDQRTAFHPAPFSDPTVNATNAGARSANVNVTSAINANRIAWIATPVRTSAQRAAHAPHALCDREQHADGHERRRRAPRTGTSQGMRRREHDREEPAESGTRRDAEEAGIGERVPYDRLHERAGRRRARRRRARRRRCAAGGSSRGCGAPDGPDRERVGQLGERNRAPRRRSSRAATAATSAAPQPPIQNRERPRSRSSQQAERAGGLDQRAVCVLRPGARRQLAKRLRRARQVEARDSPRRAAAAARARRASPPSPTAASAPPGASRCTSASRTATGSPCATSRTSSGRSVAEASSASCT